MVEIKADGINGLLEEIKRKKLICFGAGNHFDSIMNLYASYQLVSYVNCILDNNSNLFGKKKVYGGKEFEIMSIEELKKKENIKDIVVLVTSHLYSMDIVEQLDSEDEFDGVHVYIGSFLSDELKTNFDYKIYMGQESKIPKVIHYCWFGQASIPAECLNYMKSWERYCPDYEIKRWDETNFDISQNKYMEQAYKNKKWAFVSDYARIKIIHDFVGIYLDDLLSADFYCGFEDKNHVNLGLGYGAVPKHPYLAELIRVYDGLAFINENGSLNETPCTAYQTKVIKKFGIKAENSYQEKEGMIVYPTEIFAPISPWGVGMKTENTYSVHHYTASWQKKENRELIGKMYKKYYKRLTG